MEAIQSPLDKFKGHPGAEGMTTQLKDVKKTLPLRVLSEDDWQHWITKGYVIVKGAVPMENVERTIDILWRFEEKDPNDASTWYTPQRREHGREELNNSGMVEIYNHQSLWDNRQEPRLYNAYVDIWDREDLWVGIDRANLLPPARPPFKAQGFIHWDVDTTLRPLPVSVQGVLSLVRQDKDIGGFQCVPEIFTNFEEWVKTQPADRNPMMPDITGMTIENVEMDPGDLLIFNSLLAHGVRPNLTKERVRMAQYIAMYPAHEDDEAERQERIRLWREQDHPRGGWPGDPREWEKHNAEVAKLTPLGEKLLGLRRWRDQ
ncbi:phytanoyl-CoA dioxygenase family protein [Bauldia litoralis]|uniref:Ectoine hydroxylase-related dioxygenase, phytanoyl-CoA dioxygenase (PhyH) family n=1 Tax=Bauldia litoralis TaxID=665467 RepID=A0A1G6EM50_9HYPH|nr:phytanoyl-CoA dioxygenase family protein [Bauldia litoralis]SDB58470.1 Ectoine hydroxylase-related dioxygenase, phytanoyl-CoA dioxygenase (PhyH) family [Bauldia litoralis]